MSQQEIPSSTEAAKAPVGERIPLARYHLITAGFFVTTLFAQYVLFLHYLDFLPADLRGLTNAFALVVYAVYSGFMVCIIPLGVVFVFGWLYLMDIQVDVRRLYQIVAISTIPLIVLMVGSIIYGSLFMKVDPAVSQRLTELSTLLLQDVNQKSTNSAAAKEIAELLKSQREKYAAWMRSFFYLAVAISCLICGHLLHRRIRLAAWKAILIPATFALSVGFVRRLATSASGQQLMDRLKELMQP